MKKFYLLLAAALMGASANAELAFYIGETPIENGSNIEFTDITIEDYGTFRRVEMAPDLYLGSDEAAAGISVTATCTSGYAIKLCAGGECEAGESVTKSDITMKKGDKLALMMDYEGYLMDAAQEVPTIAVDIEAQEGTDESTRKSFTIVMGEEAEAGLTVIENISELKAVNGAISYSIEGEAAFTLTDLSGRTAMSCTLAGEGTLSTAELQAGIYVYTLGNKSGKIYIK